LRDAARRARSRGAPESAVAYLRRALAEPPPAADRPAALLELGAAEALIGGGGALDHLREAHDLSDDPVRRAEAGMLLGRQLFLLHGDEAAAVLRRALDELGGRDAEVERLLVAGLITNGLFAPSLHGEALQRLEAVRRRPVNRTLGEKVLLSLLAYHDARAGVPAAVVVPLVRRALADGTLLRSDAPGAAIVPASTVLAMADLDEALDIYEEVLADAHRRGSTLAFAAAKTFRAQTLVWRGDLADAESDAREALAAGGAWGGSARFSGHAAAFLADALMEQGRLEEAAATLAGADASLPDSARFLYLHDSRTRLRLLRGELAGGLEEMLEAGRRFEAVGSRNPAFIPWRSPAGLALGQLGRQEEARRLVGEEVPLARAWGAPRALGAAFRAAGLLEGGERGLALLEEAVQTLRDSPAKLEYAKA
jgi:tetratricopeptide (TPR) repeat protein